MLATIRELICVVNVSVCQGLAILVSFSSAFCMDRKRGSELSPKFDSPCGGRVTADYQWAGRPGDIYYIHR
jgi:hypothetical protein